MNQIQWYDTHCHLDQTPLCDNLESVLSAARTAGVVGILVPGINGAPVRVADSPGLTFAWGVHPQHASEWEQRIVEEEFERQSLKPVAVGECGLDKLIDVPIEAQVSLFISQLELASRERLPVIVHLRGFWEDALSLLRKHASNVPWVFHSFCGPVEVARRFLDNGAFLSISGAVCRSNASKSLKVARLVPSRRLLLETDSPYIKFDDQDSEPSQLAQIGSFVARLREVDPYDLSSELLQTVREVLGEVVEHRTADAENCN